MDGKIIDIAIKKYQLLRKEIGKMSKIWKLKIVTVVPVLIGALGAVSDILENLYVTIRLKVSQKTDLLGTARLLRIVLFLQGFRTAHPWDL